MEKCIKRKIKKLGNTVYFIIYMHRTEKTDKQQYRTDRLTATEA